MQSRMIQYMNQWLLSSSGCYLILDVLKLSKIGITNWMNMTHSLLTGSFNAFTNLFLY